MIVCNKLINEIELKDKYACALMDYHLDRLEEGQLPKLQQYIDDICADWAKTFVALHSREVADRQIQIDIFRYLDSLGVKQGHTGKRFSEALYKQLHNIFLNNQEETIIFK